MVAYAAVTNNATEWQPFSVANSDWIDESLTIFAELEPDSELDVGAPIEPNDGVINMKGPDGTFVPSTSLNGYFLPMLHYSPPLTQLGKYQNFDLYSDQEVRTAAAAAAFSEGKPSSESHMERVVKIVSLSSSAQRHCFFTNCNE